MQERKGLFWFVEAGSMLKKRKINKVQLLMTTLVEIKNIRIFFDTEVVQQHQYFR